MTKSLFTLLFFVFFQSLFSQVGIGTTTPNASAALEIKSSNSGLLLPRVALGSTSDNTTIPSPVTSLLVYNTSSTSDITPGFYYWDSGWKSFKSSGSSSGSGWNLTGNSTASTDFLGTTNYQPLTFKVNNNQFARFHPNGGLAIGNNAAAKDDNSVAIGTSANSNTNNQAVAIGPSSNAAGYQSVAIGLSANTNNNSAVAIGSSATASGYLSTAIGVGPQASSNNAMAIGNNAKASNEQSMAIGTESSATGQNATAIGYQAMATQANSIILGGTTASSKIGIGTTTPDERLHVAGSVKIVDGNQANNFVLTSDANGKASWKDPKAGIAYGEIYRATNTALTSGAINFGTSLLNSGMTLSTDKIQVQVTGVYRVTYTVSLRKSTTISTAINPEFYMGISNSEIPGTRTFVTLGMGESTSVTASRLVNLTAYQEVSVYSTLGDSNTNLMGNGCTFSVQLVK